MKTDQESIMLPLAPDQANWLKSTVRNIPDFPKPGILFRDLTTLLANREAFNFVIKALEQKFRPLKPTYIAGIEARGFIFGATLAYTLGVGFLVIRKHGKLPSRVEHVDYQLEYGTDSLEISADALVASQQPRIVLIDDLLATGGTAAAATRLLSKLGGRVVGVGCVIELTYLNGRSQFEKDIDVFSLLQYSSD